jgi:hypothetical protein
VAPPPHAEADTGMMKVLTEMNKNFKNFGGKLDDFGTQMGEVRNEAKTDVVTYFLL